MKKIKPYSTCVLAGLPQAQRELIKRWLYEENRSYKWVIARAKKDFQVSLSDKSLTRFYRKTAQDHTTQEIAQSAQRANEVVRLFTENPSDTYQALLKVGGQMAFDRALGSEDPKDLDVVRDFIRVLTSARHEDINAKKFLLDREKWEFDVARSCAQHIVDLQAIMADNSKDEDARLLAIQRRLFGTRLPE